MAMSPEQKRLAADYALSKLGEVGWDDGRLAVEAHIDAGTVRTFLKGETFPQNAKRTAIETALGIPEGTLRLVALGMAVESEAADPVEAAITKSSLSRGNKAKLIGLYFDMLDAPDASQSA
jgi:hypothetical protein